MLCDRYTDYDVFKARGKTFIVDSRKVFSSGDIVKRAASMVVEGRGRPKFGYYDAGENNCEHFATWCRSDVKTCNQPGAVVVRAIDGVFDDLGMGRPMAGIMRAFGTQ